MQAADSVLMLQQTGYVGGGRGGPQAAAGGMQVPQSGGGMPVAAVCKVVEGVRSNAQGGGGSAVDGQGSKRVPQAAAEAVCRWRMWSSGCSRWGT